MELEQAFYVIGIIFMVVMLLIVAALVVGVFIIKAKIDKIHASVDEKITALTSLPVKGVAAVSAAGKKVVTTAKKVLKK